MKSKEPQKFIQSSDERHRNRKKRMLARLKTQMGSLCKSKQKKKKKKEKKKAR